MKGFARRRFLPAALGTACLSACLFTDDAAESTIIQPGYYAAQFGPEFDSLGIESELILESAGRHRWISSRSNAAMFTSYGSWNANAEKLRLHRQAGSAVARGLFGSLFLEVFWDFEEMPDDQIPIRNFTENSFERYEAGPDNQRMMWVPYRSVVPSEIAPAKYVQVIPDSVGWNVDSLGDTLWEKSWMEYEFLSTGGFRALGYTDSVAQVEFQAYHAGVQGSFLISERPVKSYWDDSAQAFLWPDTLRGEWIFRLRNITATGFQVWDVTSYPAQWTDFRRTH